MDFEKPAEITDIPTHLMDEHILPDMSGRLRQTSKQLLQKNFEPCAISFRKDELKHITNKCVTEFKFSNPNWVEHIRNGDGVSMEQGNIDQGYYAFHMGTDPCFTKSQLLCLIKTREKSEREKEKDDYDGYGISTLQLYNSAPGFYDAIPADLSYWSNQCDPYVFKCVFGGTANIDEIDIITGFKGNRGDLRLFSIMAKTGIFKKTTDIEIDMISDANLLYELYAQKFISASTLTLNICDDAFIFDFINSPIFNPLQAISLGGEGITNDGILAIIRAGYDTKVRIDIHDSGKNIGIVQKVIDLFLELEHSSKKRMIAGLDIISSNDMEQYEEETRGFIHFLFERGIEIPGDDGYQGEATFPKYLTID